MFTQRGKTEECPHSYTHAYTNKYTHACTHTHTNTCNKRMHTHAIAHVQRCADLVS